MVALLLLQLSKAQRYGTRFSAYPKVATLPQSSDMKRLLNPKVLVTCGTLRYAIKFDVSIQKMLHISRKNSFQPVMSHDQSIGMEWILTRYFFNNEQL